MQHQPDKPIAERVCAFFERQMAWYGLVLDELDAVESRLDSDEVEARIPWSCSDGDLAAQEAQLRALLAEWRRAPRTAAETARVRALARQVEELAAHVVEELQRMSERAGSRAGEARRSLESLQKSRRIFCAYRQAETNEPGFIDEQA